MGRGIEVGEDGVGGRGDGVGTRPCIEGIRRDSLKIRITTKLRLWLSQGEYPIPLCTP